MNRDLKKLGFGILLTAAAWPAAPVLAQTADAPEAAPATQERERGLEDIVVVAQRRAENLQEVPIAITAVTSSALQAQGIKSSDEIANVTPGLTLTLQKTALQVYLRGVGTQNGGVGEEGSVATYVDGVYYSSLVATVFGFNNIDRVEVLKGPQGTLFGRNATGGLVHVITRTPSETPSIEGSFGYGNYRTVTASAYATGGLTDNVAMDLSLYYLRQNEGYGTNVVLGNEVNRDYKYGARSKILFTPGDDTRITLAADYFYNGNDIGNTRNANPGSFLIGGYTALPKKRDSMSNLPVGAFSKQYGFSGRLEQDLGFANFTSLSAYRHVRNFTAFDQDATPRSFTDAFLGDYTKSFQQEFLLVGSSDRFDWTTGLFYFHSKAVIDQFQIRSAAFASARFDRTSQQTTDSYAAFAQGTYEIFDGTKVTAGLRYTIDKREIEGEDRAAAGYVSAGGVARPVGFLLNSTDLLPALDKSPVFKKLTWRFGVDQKLAEDVLLYGTVSRGFKSGIFNGTNPYQGAVRPETLDAYEIGFKSELFDRILRLNGSVFLYKYDDIQLTSNLAGITFILNAGKATSKGFELDATLAPPLPSGALTINAGLSVLGTKYDSFAGAPSFVPRGLPGACVANSGSPACGGNIRQFIDASGNELIRAPDWTLNVSANYEFEIGDAKVALNGSWFHSDGFYWEPDNRVKLDPYDIVNAQLTIGTLDDELRLRLYVRNLLNKDYIAQFSASTDGDRVAWNTPRSYGFAIDFKF